MVVLEMTMFEMMMVEIMVVMIMLTKKTMMLVERRQQTVKDSTEVRVPAMKMLGEVTAEMMVAKEEGLQMAMAMAWQLPVRRRR
mmetsp:Transcript_3178/g.9566  ORF Transcript_3178/g.9566 Transcript_3178/m.9566 type:complete len:84 (+) Transcript_3178:102-353(+)